MTSNKIFVVQFYAGNVPYAKYAEQINSAYCKKHNYGYYLEQDSDKINTTLNFPERSYTWYKPKLILDVIKQFNPEYILFLDIDACVVDFNQTIQEYIDPDYDMIFTEDYGHHSNMNAGVFIVKNTEWVRNFMNVWWHSAETTITTSIPELSVPDNYKNSFVYFKTGLWHDQSCLSHLYRTNEEVRSKIKIISNTKLNWKEPFDGNFIYHGFAHGHAPYRKLDIVHEKLFMPTEQLTDLAKLYPTDKDYLHQYYTRVYQDVFYPIKNDVKKVVELGVLQGHSLMCWKSFFKNANIIGLDIDIEQCLFKNENRISLERVSGDNRDELSAFVNKNKDIDVFIDDGGHKMHEQQITLATIFKGIRSGGIYVLEDLHTSLECKMPEKAVFGWGDPHKTTTLDMLETFNETGKIYSDYLTKEECEYLENNIKSCIIYREKETSITSIITKKDNINVIEAKNNDETPEQLLDTIINMASQLKTKLSEFSTIPTRSHTTVTSPKLAVVYYVSLMNDWKERTSMIFDRMKFSGLYDAAAELYLVAADTENKFNELAEFVKNYPKFIVEYEPRNLGSEYRGVKRAEEIGRRNDEYNILYLHSKGVYNKFVNVSNKQGIHQLKVDGVNCWLDVMTYFTVDKWKECVDKLNEGCDTAGTRNVHRWWWGNFWWASSRHIKKLKNFEPGTRWDCESWIHEGRPNEEWEHIKFHEQFKFSYHPYYTVLPRYLYDDSDKSDIRFTIHKAEYGCFNEQQDEGRPLPSEPNVVDVTDAIKEISTDSEIIYEEHKTMFHEKYKFDCNEKNTRIYFSTSREPEREYVITTHPIFSNIQYLHKP